jgi:signal transduction histidine kinase
MDKVEFKNVTLFPKKTSLLGLTLTVFLISIATFIISSMWKTIEEIDEHHFPMVERSSINVRLVKLVDYQFEMAIMTKNQRIVEDLKLNFDSLKQNYLSLSEHSDFTKIQNTPLFSKGSAIINLLQEKKWVEAKKQMEDSKFTETLEDFSFKIFDETEIMAETRDKNSESILSLINHTLIVAIITIFFLSYLLFKVYKGYAHNLKQRLFAEEKAKMLSHQRQALIHVLCHDLSNPISAIFSLTQIGHLLPPDEKEKVIDTIKDNAQSSLDIIELIRKMQAIETGKLGLELTSIPLNEALSKSLSILNEKLATKKINIENNIHEGLSIIGDQTSLINSVFNNILSNSIKFSHENGLIRLTTERFKENVTLKIQDFGVGIPEDILPHLFSETVETSRSGTDGETGTGFGMPLVKKFIEAYGGSIAVVSSTGGNDRGTTTILTFKTKLDSV